MKKNRNAAMAALMVGAPICCWAHVQLKAAKVLARRRIRRTAEELREGPHVPDVFAVFRRVVAPASVRSAAVARCGLLGECVAAGDGRAGPRTSWAVVAWNHAEAFHSPQRHAAMVRLPVGHHPGRQLLVSRKVVAAVGRATAKPAIR